MKILAIDVGTGTQDIIYYNTEKEKSNCAALAFSDVL